MEGVKSDATRSSDISSSAVKRGVTANATRSSDSSSSAVKRGVTADATRSSDSSSSAVKRSVTADATRSSDSSSLAVKRGVTADATRSSDSSSSVVKRGVTVQECDNMIQKSFRTPMVKFLRDQLAKSGCHIGDNFIKAVNCNQKIGGSYARGVGITVCSNNINIQDEVNQVVIHNLIHAYDDCRAGNLNWDSCAHSVCSQIRANHLSGDCHYKRELLRGYTKIQGHEQDCVKRRVMSSMAGHPYCSEIASKDAMDAVWDICYNDTKPFDRAP